MRAPTGTYLLRAPIVLTGLDEQPFAPGAIRVRGSRIEAVGSQFTLPPGQDDVVVDFPGQALLPGLIDCHEHLSGHGRFSIGDDTVSEPDAMYALVAIFHARLCLDQGVTTARLVGTPGHIDLMLRRAISEGYVEGPRLICSGMGLTMTGGHFYGVGVEVDGPHSAAKAARANFGAGADFVKMFASAGVGISHDGDEPRQRALTVEEMSAVVAVAHAAGRKATAHAHGAPSIANAIEAGVDCIEHGIFLEADQARLMADRHIALVPTLCVMRGIAQKGTEWELPDLWVQSARRVLEPHTVSVRAALDAGVVVATGTDGAGDLVEEIEILASLGLSPYRAIQAATRDAARVIGPDARYGTLQQGYLADIIAVSGNPLQALGALREVQFVMLEGAVVRNRLERPDATGTAERKRG